MMSPSRSRSRPYRRLLRTGAGMWFLAALMVGFQGVIPLVYIFVIAGALQVAAGIRGSSHVQDPDPGRHGDESAVVRQDPNGYPPEGSASRRSYPGRLAASLLWGLFFVALFVGASLAPWPWRLPLFAGADLSVVNAGFSETVGVHIAEPGKRFLVVDLEVRPRLLADLGHLSQNDFRLRLNDGSLLMADDAYFSAPGYCSGPMPRRGRRVCSIVFSVDGHVTDGIVEYHDGVYAGATRRFDSFDAQAAVPRIKLTTKATSRVRAHPSGRGRHAPDGKRYLYVSLRLEPQRASEPVENFSMILVAPGVEEYDRSSTAHLSRPCGEVEIEAVTYCTAIFEVPEDLRSARVKVLAYGSPVSLKNSLAGVTDVSF